MRTTADVFRSQDMRRHGYRQSIGHFPMVAPCRQFDDECPRCTLCRSRFTIDIKDGLLRKRGQRDGDGRSSRRVKLAARRLPGNNRAANAKVGVLCAHCNARDADACPMKQREFDSVFCGSNQPRCAFEDHSSVRKADRLWIAEHKIPDIAHLHAAAKAGAFHMNIVAMTDHRHRISLAVKPHTS